jgi:pyrimidine operon attenuation protein/uracil phosphoribosyltransferase
MEAKDPTLILDHWEIEQKVRRMAHQVLEEHYKEKQIVFVAVKGMGTLVAELLLQEFTKASDIPAT